MTFKTFSELLTTHMDKAKLTKVELATKVGIHVSQISRYTQQGIVPSPTRIQEIADVFNIIIRKGENRWITSLRPQSESRGIRYYHHFHELFDELLYIKRTTPKDFATNSSFTDGQISRLRNSTTAPTDATIRIVENYLLVDIHRSQEGWYYIDRISDEGLLGVDRDHMVTVGGKSEIFHETDENIGTFDDNDFEETEDSTESFDKEAAEKEFKEKQAKALEELKVKFKYTEHLSRGNANQIMQELIDILAFIGASDLEHKVRMRLINTLTRIQALVREDLQRLDKEED